MQVDHKGRPTALCRNCMVTEGRPCPAVACDHIVPMSKADANGMIRDAFGTAMNVNDTRNLQPLCEDCHDAKTARENDERQRKGRPRLTFDANGFPIWPE